MNIKITNLSEINRDTYEFAQGNDFDYNLFENVDNSTNIWNNHAQASLIINKKQKCNNTQEKRSYYMIENNVLDDLSFGFNPLGTNGCLPPETSHQ